MWIFAQSLFKSVLLGRHTSSPIPESLCLEFVAPPSHSAHRPQGGLRQSTAFFGTQTSPVGQPPAWVWFQQLCAPQTTFVHVRVPLAHLQELQSSCTSVLCRWRMTPLGRRQCLQSCSSSGGTEVIVLDSTFAIRFVPNYIINFLPRDRRHCCEISTYQGSQWEIKIIMSRRKWLRSTVDVKEANKQAKISVARSLTPFTFYYGHTFNPFLPWQRVPDFPGGQMHSKPLILSLHVAPSLHGVELHSLMLILQTGPVNPGAHLHECQPSPSIHVAPLWQGLEAQSSTSEKQSKDLVFGGKKKSLIF